jgi:hypothetical protein
MTRLVITLTILVLTAGLSAQTSELPQAPKEITLPLRDGFTYNGIEGTLTKPEDQDKWFFTADVDITDTKGTVKAGQPVEMLPASTLERIVENAEDKSKINIKLWARVTRYSNRNILLDKLPSRKFINRKVERKTDLDKKFLDDNVYNKNYLFAMYFIPMTVQVEPEEKPNEETKPKGDSIIPEDILKQLQPKKVVNLVKLKEAMDAEIDVVLANRTGFVVVGDEKKTFTIDSLGRKLDDLSFELLDCEALEATEENLVMSPTVRQRFKVSGIITTYKGKHYMLPQRATRTYSHGNFAR